MNTTINYRAFSFGQIPIDQKQLAQIIKNYQDRDPNNEQSGGNSWVDNSLFLHSPICQLFKDTQLQLNVSFNVNKDFNWHTDTQSDKWSCAIPLYQANETFVEFKRGHDGKPLSIKRENNRLVVMNTHVLHRVYNPKQEKKLTTITVLASFTPQWQKKAQELGFDFYPLFK